MSKISMIAASVAVLPVLAFSTPAFADVTVGQIESGNIYRVRNLTANANGAFDGTTDATCGQTVQFRVRIHNGGPNPLNNVKVAATLDNSNPVSHGSTVTVTADNNLDGRVVTASAGVKTDKATTISYVAGSTELLGYSATAGQSPVLRALPDGITTTGVNIGTVGPLTPDTVSVQFQAKLDCDVTPPTTPGTIQVCNLTTKQLETIKESDFNSSKYTRDLTKCNATPNTLVKTGPTQVAAVFAAAAAFGAVAYNVVLRRRSSN